MPAFSPAPRPRFSCSTTRTSGNPSRTRSTVPSVDPWSTRIVSSPARLSSHSSPHGSPFRVTVTAESSATAFESRLLAGSRSAQRLPAENHGAGQRECDRDDEEQETGRERRVCVDTELTQEADEERLAHGEAV